MADASRTAGIAADQTWRYREAILGRFEAAWRSGPRPRIEEFIPAPPGSNLHLLIEIIHLDVEYRLRAGEKVTATDYTARFPELGRHPAALLSLARAANVDEDLKKLETERAAAVVRGDAATLAKQTSDDYTFINVSGRMSDKSQMVNVFKTGQTKLTSDELSGI